MVQDDLFSLYLAKLGASDASAGPRGGLPQLLVQCMLTPAALAPRSSRKLLVSCLHMLGYPARPGAEQAPAEELQRMAVQARQSSPSTVNL